MTCYYQITVEFFRTLFKEKASATDDEINQYLSMAQDCGSGVSKTLGKVYNEAVLYYAAHMMELADRRQAAAVTRNIVYQNQTDTITVVETNSTPIISDSVGAMSNSYATSKTMTEGTTRESGLLTTPYGAKYLSLTKNTLKRMIVVNYDNNRC